MTRNEQCQIHVWVDVELYDKCKELVERRKWAYKSMSALVRDGMSMIIDIDNEDAMLARIVRDD